MEISFILTLRSEECCWNCSLSSENISATNLCENGDFASCFSFRQYVFELMLLGIQTLVVTRMAFLLTHKHVLYCSIRLN